MSTMDLLNLFGEFIEFMRAKSNTVIPAEVVSVEAGAEAEPAVVPVVADTSAEEYISVREFATAKGITVSKAYEWCKKNAGGLAIHDSINHKWRVKKSAIEEGDKKNWSRKGIHILCHELEREFKSLRSASAETKVSIEQIRKGCQTGQKVGGYHFSRPI